MSFTGAISSNLTVEELLDLASLYREIQINSEQIVQLACAFKVPVALVYAELVRAQKEIAERVSKLKGGGKR